MTNPKKITEVCTFDLGVTVVRGSGPSVSVGVLDHLGSFWHQQARCIGHETDYTLARRVSGGAAPVESSG